MTLDEIFDHGRDAARHLFEAQGCLTPMWLMETVNGEFIPVMVPFGSPDEKEMALEALKELMRDKQVVRYVSMVEAWALEAQPDDKVDDLLDAGPVREHPDRKEIVQVTAEDKYHTKSGWFSIIRDSKDPHLSAFNPLPDDCRMEGLFTHLLASGESVN